MSCLLNEYLYVQTTHWPSLFPFYSDSLSDEEEEMEGTEEDGELQIVTECWVEPQHGTCSNNPIERQSFEGLPCRQIPFTVSNRHIFLFFFLFSSNSPSLSFELISFLLAHLSMKSLGWDVVIGLCLASVTGVPTSTIANQSSSLKLLG